MQPRDVLRCLATTGGGPPPQPAPCPLPTRDPAQRSSVRLSGGQFPSALRRNRRRHFVKDIVLRPFGPETEGGGGSSRTPSPPPPSGSGFRLNLSPHGDPVFFRSFGLFPFFEPSFLRLQSNRKCGV